MTLAKAITFTFPGGSQQYKTTYWFDITTEMVNKMRTPVETPFLVSYWTKATQEISSKDW